MGMQMNRRQFLVTGLTAGGSTYHEGGGNLNIMDTTGETVAIAAPDQLASNGILDVIGGVLLPFWYRPGSTAGDHQRKNRLTPTLPASCKMSNRSESVMHDKPVVLAIDIDNRT